MPTHDTSNALPEIVLNWRQHLSYDSARNETKVIYLFEWNDEPFYWGIANRSAFGKRYNVGYRHLIEGALQHGGKLYLASPENLPTGIGIAVVENQLIVKYNHVMNTRINLEAEKLKLSHEGDVPHCIENDITQQKEPKQSHIIKHLKEGRTIARTNPFKYQLTDVGVSIYPNDEVKHSFSTDDLMTVIEAVQIKYVGESFPLDNSATPNENRELGFGSLFCEVLNRKRGLAPATSYLISIFCEAGIFDHFQGTGQANDPTRFRLIMIPESKSELLNLIGFTPEGYFV